MATCVKCDKPIGLIEYTLGDSKQLGLCKTCRKTEHWCDQCTNFMTLSIRNSPVIRCLKYGYDLSDKKKWKVANNCPDFRNKIRNDNKKTKPLKKQKPTKTMLSRNWF